MDVYEKEIEYLKLQLLRINNSSSIFNLKKIHSNSIVAQCRLANELLNDDEKHQLFTQRIKEEFLHVHSMVVEANTIADEMQGQVIYYVILHIPVAYLKPSERNVNNLCQVAVQVKSDNSSSQVWSIEKFQSKLNDMKEIYEQWKTSKIQTRPTNLFFDDESERLIGVANIYLKALFYNSKLDYIVPIINTQGELCGSLHVVLDQTESSSIKNLSDFQINSTTRGSMSEGIAADIDEQSLSNSQPSLEDEGIDEFSALSNGKNEQITVKFAIKEVRDLPQTNAKHILCRYTFINPKLDQTVLSIDSSTNENEQNSRIFFFDHENEYTFPITDHFLSRCLEGAVSIEVWSQHKPKRQSVDIGEDDEASRREKEVRAISLRWKDVKRHVQFSVEIQELDSMGQWGAVEVDAQEQILSGGIYRLKQGHSKRLVTRLRILPRSDPMPLSFHAIRSVEIGSISTRKIDAPLQLDSYQDEDLKELRAEWLNAIEKEKMDLICQVNLINQQTNKTPNDNRRERILLEKLLRLADERNIAVFPPPSSGIPGAPASWSPPTAIEMHRPLLFLNINSSNRTAGLQSILNEENKTKMLSLPLIQHASDKIQAIAVWDPAIHESSAIDQVTPQDTLIYLIVKITVLLTEPIQMEILLRKRIAVTISKTEGWWPGKTLKNLLGYKTSKQTSVVYEIVSKIPPTIQTNEDLNITDSDVLSNDSLEKYLQHASAIDSVLLLDKLRQGVLLAENSAKQQIIRKTMSVPDITPKKRHTTLFHSPAIVRRENIPNLTESIVPLAESKWNDSTPSMLSRSSFIEEQQIQPIARSSFRIKPAIDLEENQEQNDENTLELKYPIIANQSPKQTIENNDQEEFALNCRVIVNTGRSIINKVGIIRFIGATATHVGEWYGIELEEPIGKNNGSLDGHPYFHCPDRHGIFVRRDKLERVH